MDKLDEEIQLPIISFPSTLGTLQLSYVNPTPGHLPLMGLGTLNDCRDFSEATLQAMKDCGLNIAEGILTASNIPKVLERAEKVGMKIMVRYEVLKDAFDLPSLPEESEDSTEWYNYTNSIKKLYPYSSKWDNLNNIWSDIISKNSGHPAVAGWMFYDEPGQNIFWGMSRLKNTIDEKESSHHMIFSNMYPSHASLYQMTGGLIDVPSGYIGGYVPKITGYYDYIAAFRNLFHPDMLSVDTYPFWVHNLETHLQCFLNDLIFYKELAATRFGVPFWSTVQTCQENKLFEDVSVGRIRFMSFLSLLFGASGLSFFRFSDNNEHQDSPLDINGNKTATYDMLHTVVQEIIKRENIFLNRTSSKVAFTNYIPNTDASTCPKLSILKKKTGSHYLETPYGFLDYVSAFGSNGVAVASIKTDSNEYIIVMNLDWEQSQRVVLKFTKYVTHLTATTPTVPPIISGGKTSANDNERAGDLNGDLIIGKINTFQADLEPGDWKIFMA